MAGELGRVMTAMVTPFEPSGSVDLELAGRLAQALVASGSDGVVVNGTTGESPTLRHDERIALVDAVREALPDSPMVVGTGSYDTAAAVAATREARDHGADAALVVTPYYNKPPLDGLVAHFEAVADVGLPVILYNIPSRTGVNIPAATTLRLAEHPGIAGTKESAGNADQVAQVAAGAPPGFRIWSGEDELTLPYLSVGAHGVISVASHVVGRAVRSMVEAYLDGRVGEARSLHHRLLPIFKGLFVTSNPIPVKAALEHLGVAVGRCRPPLAALDADRRASLDGLLDSAPDLVGLSISQPALSG